MLFFYREAATTSLGKDALVEHLDSLNIYSVDKIQIIASAWEVQVCGSLVFSFRKSNIEFQLFLFCLNGLDKKYNKEILDQWIITF